MTRARDGVVKVGEGIPIHSAVQLSRYRRAGEPSPTLTDLPMSSRACAGSQDGNTTRVPKQKSLTDQVRRAILDAPISRYELAKRLGVSQGTLGDFVHGRTGIGSELLDQVAVELGLRLVVADTRPRRPKKTRR